VEAAVEVCQIFKVGYHIRRILVHKLTRFFFCNYKKDSFFPVVLKKSFLAFFGGEELSLYFQKTKKMTHHLSYDTMTKSTSSTMKAAATIKKKSDK
jgi:hypothetical protein